VHSARRPNAPAGAGSPSGGRKQPQTFPGQHGRSDQNAGARPEQPPQPGRRKPKQSRNVHGAASRT